MTRSVFVLLLLVPTGCDLLEPTQATGDPFYYYQGIPVYVDPDPSRLVIAYSPGLANDVDVPSLLQSYGLSVTRTDTLKQVDNHYVFSVAGTVANSSLAVEDLRKQPGVEFVSLGYTIAETTDTLLLVNELIVSFKDGVSRHSIDNLLTVTGARIVRAPVSLYGSHEYLLAYPKGSDPLAFAAELYNHPFVEWTDPNKIALGFRPGLIRARFIRSRAIAQSW